MTLFINLYGGPGVGKSTTAAGVFYELKTRGFNVELVPEFAKDLAWEGRGETLSNQVYVTGRQFHMIKKLDGKADIVVTDSPVMLGAVYGKGYPKCYRDCLFWCHQQVFTEGLNFLLRRNKPFSMEGRVHDEKQSLRLDDEIKMMLLEYDIAYQTIDQTSAVEHITSRVMRSFYEC